MTTEESLKKYPLRYTLEDALKERLAEERDKEFNLLSQQYDVKFVISQLNMAYGPYIGLIQ